MDPTSQYGKLLAEKREKNRRQELAKTIVMSQESDPGEMVSHWSSLNMWQFADPNRRNYMEAMRVSAKYHKNKNHQFSMISVLQNFRTS